MKWEKTGLLGAVNWMADKTIEYDDEDVAWQRGLPDGMYFGMPGVSFVRFDDGCVCLAVSICHGPYSEVTPDLDFDPPVFWLGEPGEDVGHPNVHAVFKRGQDDPNVIYGGIVKSEDHRDLRVQVCLGSGMPIKTFVLPAGSEVEWGLPPGAELKGHVVYGYLPLEEWKCL